MHIWVDADACPAVIKDILFRAAQRTGLAMTLVANHPMRVAAGPNIRLLQVPSGFDVADNEIVRRLKPGDLVITSDIPLAAEVIEADGQALSPRGELFVADSIRARLNMRDFLETMRSSGIHSDGPPPLNSQDRKAFARHLDTILARVQKPAGQ